MVGRPGRSGLIVSIFSAEGVGGSDQLGRRGSGPGGLDKEEKVMPENEEANVLGDCSCVSGQCGEPFKTCGRGGIKK